MSVGVFQMNVVVLGGSQKECRGILNEWCCFGGSQNECRGNSDECCCFRGSQNDCGV